LPSSISNRALRIKSGVAALKRPKLCPYLDRPVRPLQQTGQD
jgi:hypothetical protein